MTDLVPTADIERLVGARRHPFGHTTHEPGAARRTAKPAHERAAYLAHVGVELLDGGESDG